MISIFKNRAKNFLKKVDISQKLDILKKSIFQKVDISRKVVISQKLDYSKVVISQKVDISKNGYFAKFKDSGRGTKTCRLIIYLWLVKIENVR